MHPWHDTYIDDRLIETAFPTVIEIPKGSTNKYELDKETGLLRLDRARHRARGARDVRAAPARGVVAQMRWKMENGKW
jgi:inorganic pyrophosphatase